MTSNSSSSSTSSQTTTFTDTELVNVARQLPIDSYLYFDLGTHLKIPLTELEQILRECNNDLARSTIMMLRKWRDGQEPGTKVRQFLAQYLNHLKFKAAAGVLSTEPKDEYTQLTVETTPSEASSSITKRSLEDNLDSVSMVTSVMSSDSSSDFSLSVHKESKFDAGSVRSSPYGGSRQPLTTSGASSVTSGIGHLDLSNEAGDERVEQWIDDNTHVPQTRGAFAADALSDSEVSVGRAETLTLRGYQLELAQPALDGHNTIIVAPTGSGKTYIAVAIAQEVLRKTGGMKKIIFVVNQVPLVHQQSTVFRKYMARVSYLCGYHGQPQPTRLPLDQLLLKNDVVVLTAQILVDALDKKQVSLKDIGLIVFDECHETKKECQYNDIMRKYIHLKDANEQPLPQIIGMTASLGVGKAQSKEDARLYMLKMCANLDAVKISTVQNHKESLAEVENKPDEDTHVVGSREADTFSEEIQDIMLKIFLLINSKSTSRLLSDTLSKLSTLRSSKHSCDSFSHILSRLDRGITEHRTSPNEQLSLVTCTEHLKEYSTCLSIHETARTKDAFQYIQSFIGGQRQKAPNLGATDKKLLELFQNREETLERISCSPESANPGLVKLQGLIETAVNSCANSTGSGATPFRGILFTQTIASTWALKNWVTETKTLKDLNPEVLVGSRNPGMSLSHQTEVLDKFRAGVHKLIIATSVIQKGIDVPACNFVFRYNYISDAVGRIQERGRTRTAGGRFELVVHQYRGLHDKDKFSKDQEELMKSTTESVSSLAVKEMTEKISEIRQQEHFKLISKRDTQKPLDVYNFGYHCRKCDELACRSVDIRVVPGGHHVIVNPQIFEIIEIRDSSTVRGRDKRRWSSVEHTDKEIRCTNPVCGIKWGSVLTCRDGYLLALSVKSFRLRHSAAKLKPFQKWGALPFSFNHVSVANAAFKKLSAI